MTTEEIRDAIMPVLEYIAEAEPDPVIRQERMGKVASLVLRTLEASCDD